MSNNNHLTTLFPVIDRVLLFSWLLKDFGWMTTNVYLGFTFGAISVLLHLLLVVIDTRKSYRFYNTSLILWVSGNFMWMTVEFVDTNPSSNVHTGPHVPLGGVSEQTIDSLVTTKTIFFLLGSLIQISMYIAVYSRCVFMPEEDDEDMISKNEVNILFGLTNTTIKPYTKQADFDSLFDLADDFSFSSGDSSGGSAVIHNNTLTLAFIENAYIMFWISKDLFWSWSTGDLAQGRDLVIVFESAALCFGSLAIFVYLVTAYIYRRNFLRFLDALTTIFWISANFVWMCGELFIRYDNLQYDDATEHNDGVTRVIASCLFCAGIALQLYVTLKLVRAYRQQQSSGSSDGNHSNSQQVSSGGGKRRYVEMLSMFRNPTVPSTNKCSTSRNSPSSSGGPDSNNKYRHINMIMTAFSPQHRSTAVSTVDDDEEDTVLF